MRIQPVNQTRVTVIKAGTRAPRLRITIKQTNTIIKQSTNVEPMHLSSVISKGTRSIRINSGLKNRNYDLKMTPSGVGFGF